MFGTTSRGRPLSKNRSRACCSRAILSMQDQAHRTNLVLSTIQEAKRVRGLRTSRTREEDREDDGTNMLQLLLQDPSLKPWAVNPKPTREHGISKPHYHMAGTEPNEFQSLVRSASLGQLGVGKESLSATNCSSEDILGEFLWGRCGFGARVFGAEGCPEAA